jgi:hypothetical protein
MTVLSTRYLALLTGNPGSAPLVRGLKGGNGEDEARCSAADANCGYFFCLPISSDRYPNELASKHPNADTVGRVPVNGKTDCPWAGCKQSRKYPLVLLD